MDTACIKGGRINSDIIPSPYVKEKHMISLEAVVGSSPVVLCGKAENSVAFEKLVGECTRKDGSSVYCGSSNLRNTAGSPGDCEYTPEVGGNMVDTPFEKRRFRYRYGFLSPRDVSNLTKKN
mmetsp:Transcript_1911/g.5365  ORF Transcript_1911/g.5365 Transcript_1911/m.5365 type:complete len:122 (-) Transcript_1911:20-385(-)